MSKPISSPGITSSHSHSSLSSQDDSFCLSSNYSTSVSELQEPQPTEIPLELGNKLDKRPVKLSKDESLYDANLDLLSKPSFKPSQLSNPAKTIYSFDWTDSNIQSSNNHFPPDDPISLVNVSAMDPGAQGHQVDLRCVQPDLPPPTLWSTLTHKKCFSNYIKAENLNTQYPEPFSTTECHPVPEKPEFNKDFPNIELITQANFPQHKIRLGCPMQWVSDHLLSNANLPVPFNPSLITSDPNLWTMSPGVSNFATLPNLADAFITQTWLNFIGNSIGIHHGLIELPDPSQPDKRVGVLTPAAINLGCGDRSFDCEGSDKALSGGLLRRKPDIVVVDRNFRLREDKSVRLGWPLVQGLIEITTDTSRSSKEVLKNFLQKAANTFAAQLHRRFIFGFILQGKAPNLSFYVIFVDRAGAIVTEVCSLTDFHALTFGRILYMLTFGNDLCLGMDPLVTFDRFTGKPLLVTVENRKFIIITEIFASPYLFSRGTRVYIVIDKEDGKFHILKDSWILSDHAASEIENIKKISHLAATTEHLSQRFRALCPRFVAGEDNIYTTDTPRGVLPSNTTSRIRRRIVTGPIGDPITSYRSRVEALQAFIDIAQRKYLC